MANPTTAITLGAQVRTPKGRTGQVVHLFTDALGGRVVFVRMDDTGRKSPWALADLAPDTRQARAAALGVDVEALCPESCGHPDRCADDRAAITRMERNAEMAVERYYEGGWDTAGVMDDGR